MKMQIKNSHKVIAGTTLFVARLFITALKAKENIAQAQNTSGSQTKASCLNTGIHLLMMSDKVEALRKFITGWQEVQE